jgi:hypothetical protein
MHELHVTNGGADDGLDSRESVGRAAFHRFIRHYRRMSIEGASEGNASESEVVVVSGPGTETPEPIEPVEVEETVSEPGKVMRIGSMIKQLLDEVRQAPLDERSRSRLREIYERSLKELGASLSGDLRTELEGLALPFADDEVPSESELRIAQAQLVGWLEGLFHGIQATLYAQQLAAQAQLQGMRQRGLPPGVTPEQMMAMQNGSQPAGSERVGGGTYL